jgi:ABC-2 type transport system ATP-binding protein
MIAANNISKSYQNGKVLALDAVSLRVERGELFGLIGPDGAGKTSLFRILATLLLADSGTASVGGRDVVADYKAIRHTIGYMPGRFSLYQDLSIWENLEFYATVFGTTIEANYEQIKPIYQQIEPFKARRAGQLSGGMKQKLALCCALVHQPEVLLLDEPTTGVDPVSRQEFWDILNGLREQGLTMLVSTPYMDEAGRCDRIALIQNGRILAQNTPQRLVDDHAVPMWKVSGANMFGLLQAIRAWSGTYSCYAFGESHHVVLNPDARIEDLRTMLTENGFHNLTIGTIRPDIEDTFIYLTSTATV